jgi:hypothetical protein
MGDTQIFSKGSATRNWLLCIDNMPSIVCASGFPSDISNLK